MNEEAESVHRQFKLKSKIDLSTMLGLKPFRKSSTEDEQA